MFENVGQLLATSIPNLGKENLFTLPKQIITPKLNGQERLRFAFKEIGCKNCQEAF